MSTKERNKKNVRAIINAIGFSFGILMLVNLIGFALAWIFMDHSAEYNLLFEHGTFYINGKPTGLEWGEHNTSTLLVVLFIVGLVFQYRKGSLQFKGEDRST